jgi:hypothetical protein
VLSGWDYRLRISPDFMEIGELGLDWANLRKSVAITAKGIFDTTSVESRLDVIIMSNYVSYIGESNLFQNWQGIISIYGYTGTWVYPTAEPLNFSGNNLDVTANIPNVPNFTYELYYKSFPVIQSTAFDNF